MAEVASRKRESLSQLAYEQIKAMILQKELKPGQFINEAQLQEQLNLGRTPVREAILALAQNSLVTVHPRRGIEITRPTPKAVHDIFEIRALMEPMILRECFQRIDLQWALDMRAQLLQHAELGSGSASQTEFELIDLDNQFHLGLVDTLHNQYVTNMMHSMADYLSLIRFTVWNPEDYLDSNQTHINIMDAILKQDVDEACSLLTKHLRMSYQEAINTMMHTEF